MSDLTKEIRKYLEDRRHDHKIVADALLEQAVDDLEGYEKDDAIMVVRLRRVIELINAGENHMAVAKLLADISALTPTKVMK